MSKKVIIAVLAVALAVGILIYNSDAMKEARFVKSLVARNIEARGGAEAWEAVESLWLAGQMDLGQEMVVPYVLVQKRPGKMCLQFEFDGETTTQCTDGDSGWKVAPFRGRSTPEPMTEVEFRETADSADPYGLLYDYAARDHDVELVGQEQIDGRDTYKLQITLPLGGVRWLYIDAETALEVKLEAMRTILRREFRVETLYVSWQEVEGLLIPQRQETRTEGDEESHFITVDSVTVNPPLDDARFGMPVSLNASNGSNSSNSS
jgi:hypothetical protein